MQTLYQRVQNDLTGFVSLNIFRTSVSDASEDSDKNPLKLCRSVYTLLSEVRKPSFTFMK